METEIINIDFYSEVEENDFVLNLKVEYEIVISGGGDTDEDESKVVWTSKEDVSILSEIPNKVSLEFFDSFDNYIEEITEMVEEAINE